MRPRTITKLHRKAEAQGEKLYWHQVTGAINPKTGEPGYRELPGRAHKPPKDEADEQRIADKIMRAAEKRLKKRNKRMGA